MKKITGTLCLIALCVGDLSAMQFPTITKDIDTTNVAVFLGVSQKTSVQIAQYNNKLLDIEKEIHNKEEEQQQLISEIERVSQEIQENEQFARSLIDQEKKLKQELNKALQSRSKAEKMISYFLPSLELSDPIVETLNKVKEERVKNEDLLKNLKEQRRDLDARKAVVFSGEQTLIQRREDLNGMLTTFNETQILLRQGAVAKLWMFLSVSCNAQTSLFVECLNIIRARMNNSSIAGQFDIMLSLISSPRPAGSDDNDLQKRMIDSELDTSFLSAVSDLLPHILLQRRKNGAPNDEILIKDGLYQLSQSVKFVGEVIDDSDPQRTVPHGNGKLELRYGGQWNNNAAFQISVSFIRDDVWQLNDITQNEQSLFSLGVNMNLMLLKDVDFASFAAQNEELRVLFGQRSGRNVVFLVSTYGIFLGEVSYSNNVILNRSDANGINLCTTHRYISRKITGNEFTYSNGDVYLNGGHNFYNVTPSRSHPGETVLALLQRLSSEHESAETQRALPYNPDLSVSDSTGTHVQIDEVSDNESAGHGLEMRQENDEKPVQKKVDNN